MKNFCSVKNPVKRIKRQATDWENVFANYIYSKGFISRVHKELPKLNCKKANTQFPPEINPHLN